MSYYAECITDFYRNIDDGTGQDRIGALLIAEFMSSFTAPPTKQPKQQSKQTLSELDKSLADMGKE